MSVNIIRMRETFAHAAERMGWTLADVAEFNADTKPRWPNPTSLDKNGGWIFSNAHPTSPAWPRNVAPWKPASKQQQQKEKGRQMFDFSVKSDIDKIIRNTKDLAHKQIPFATARALTETAKVVKKAEEREIKSVFDRPTPYTQRSIYYKSANKKTLQAKVWLKDDTSKGTPATKYLGPQIQGGQRPVKRFERALQRAGYLPQGWFAVPGAGAKMDRYGNMSRGQIVQILSALKSFGEQGYLANRTKDSAKRSRNQPEFFAIKPGQRRGGLAPGVWQRHRFAHGSAVKPVLIFVSGATFHIRFKFHDVAKRTVSREIGPQFKQALTNAMATAR